MIILSLTAYSDTNWWTWGNIGFQGAGVGVDDILWGSNYPQGNITMDNVTLGVTNDFPPIIADLNGDGENELYTFSGSSIIVYDNNLETITSENIGAPIQGQACVYNYQSDDDLEIAIMSDSTLKIYELDGNNLDLVNSISLPKAYYDVYCTVGFNGDQFIIAHLFGDFSIVDGESGTHDEIENQISGYDTCVRYTATGSHPSYSLNNYQNRGFYFDVDDDTDHEFCNIQAITTTADVKLNCYDVVDGEWAILNATVLSGYAGDCKELDIGYGNVGSITGNNEIIVREYVDGLSPKIRIAVVSIAGTVSYTEETTGSGATFQQGNYITFPSIADYDTDSLNEMCYYNKGNFTCIGGSMSIKYNYPFKAHNTSTDKFYKFMAMGEYSSNDPLEYLEVITPEGMFKLNVATTPDSFDCIMNFSDYTSNNQTMVLPASIEQQASFTKDLAIFDKDLTRVFTRKATASVCGNLICESGETILNCPADCSEDLVTAQVIINSVEFNPSTSNVWLNNTQVRIRPTINSTNGATVSTRVILYDGTSYEEDSGWQEYYPSGTTFTLFMTANHTTTNGYVRVQARASSQPNVTVQRLYGISVGLQGDSYGDSSNTFTYVAEEETPADEIDLDNNALYDMVYPIAEATNMGVSLWWIIIMIAVGLTVFIGLNVLTGGQAVSLSFLMFGIIEFLMLIVGTMAGFIGVGFIVTITVVALVVIGIFVGKWVLGVGSGQG